MDIFKNVSTTSDNTKIPTPPPAQPPKPKPQTDLQNKINSITLANAQNSTLNRTEKEIIDLLVEYDQKNGKDLEYSGAFSENYPIKVAHVSDTDVRDFGKENGLNQTQIDKVLTLTRKWRGEANSYNAFFKDVF